MSFLSFLPVVGDILDPILGFTDTLATNSANKDIARMNIEQQERTNQWNYKMNQETNKSNRDINAATNKSNKDIADAYNANQVQLQNDMNVFNKKMWDLNNQYNSPTQQLQRAAEAGINPNVVFGQPVAASPVQQTSIPNQALAQMSPYYNQSYKADAPQNNMKYQAKGLQQLGKALRSLGRLPFVKEELDAKKLANDKSRLENEVLQYDRDMRKKDLDDRKNVENLYNSMCLIENVNDPNDLITPDEYDFLSDEDKKKYNTTDVNGAPLPNLLKSGFKSRAAFEAWKDIRNIPNFLQNIKTDLTQSRLRYLVDSKKIESDDAINAMVNMDNASYNRLLYSVKQIKQDLQFNRETWNDRKRAVKAIADKGEGENKFFDESYQTRLHILQMSDEEAINKVDRNALSLARKWMGDGKLSSGECAKLLLLKAAGFIE